MKRTIKVLLAALFVAGFTIQSNAQNCVPNPPSGNAGITPNWQELECANNDGSAYTDTLFVENFDTVTFGGNPVVVNSLTVTGITGLPTGLTYQFDNGSTTSRTLTGGEAACVRVFGTTTCAPGRYKLAVNASISLGSLPTLGPAEACQLYSLAGQPGPCPFEFYINVKAPSAACDTNAAVTTNCAGTGINEIENVSSFVVSPNPVKTQAEIKFSLINPANLDVAIYNSIGQRVVHQSVEGFAGVNRVSIDRGNLTPGVYLFALEQDGKMVVSKQTMLE